MKKKKPGKAKKGDDSGPQLGLFDRPAKKRTRKKPLVDSEVRTYKTRAGHTYELRRVQ